MNWDIIVIGAGHNGLTAAAMLAKKGRKVLVLERQDRIGGLAASSEFAPGYRTQGLLSDTSGVRRAVARSLDLKRHGLEFMDAEPPVFIPQQKGPGLLFYRCSEKAAEELGKLSQKDAAAYKEFKAFIRRLKPLVRRVLDQQPPSVVPDASSLIKLLKTGLALRKLGEKDMLEVLRVGPMCVADWFNERFENDLFKTALCAPALFGTYMGPWSAGTVATWLIRECVAEAPVKGGPAALVKALEAAAKSHGVHIRLKAPVKGIRIKDGKVAGAVLEDGTELHAPVVLSSCDPKRTFFGLVTPSDLPLELEKQIRVFKQRGTTAKVNLALKGPLEFSSRPGQVFEAARVCGEKIDDLEKAFDFVKYKKFSEKPQLEIRVPTVSDPSLAPAGHHVAEILVHFAPYDLAGGWTAKRREELGDVVLAELARYAPSVKERLVAREVLTPADLEDRYGLTGGHIHHGEHGLDQLYALRPSVDTARYATPIPGLFLTGGGTHPGGGITCAPGALAAETVLKRS